MPTLVERDRTQPSAPEIVVRVAGPEGQGSRVRERRRLSLGSIGVTTAIGAVAVALLLFAGAVTGLIDIGNPFGTTTTDRSPHVLLKQLNNLSQFDAARGTFQTTVNVEDSVGFLPQFIAGETVTFIGEGTVDASVNFSQLSTSAISVDANHAVTIRLPKPVLGRPSIDPHASHVANRSRGLIDRAISPFEDNPTGDQRFYVLAEKKIAQAARESNLVTHAEANTTEMLRGLLGRLGYPQVTVIYGSTPGAGGRAGPASR